MSDDHTSFVCHFGYCEHCQVSCYCLCECGDFIPDRVAMANNGEESD